MGIENLRREARVEARVPVVVYRGKTPVPLLTSDVSFRGLFIETTQPFPLRSLVRLRVRLPDGEIEAHAMAVHIVDDGDGREAGVGLQFWGLAGPGRQAWDAYVRMLVQEKRRSVKIITPREAIHPAMLDGPTPSGIRVVAQPVEGAKVKRHK